MPLLSGHLALRWHGARGPAGAPLRVGSMPLPASAIAPQRIRRVLVCRPNHRLGNLLLLTPLLQELAQRLPAARVDLAVAGDAAPRLFAGFANVGYVYALSRRMVRHPWQTARIVLQIRRARYDLVIDPSQRSRSAHWLTVIAHAPHSVNAGGVAAGVAGTAAPRHMAKWPVYVLRRALMAPDAEYPALDLHLTATERQQGWCILRRLIQADAARPRVLGVFAEATGAKRYPEAWWLRCLGLVAAQAPGFQIVEIAPPDGRSRLSAHFPVFSSADLREVAAVISQVTGFISADCGVMHLACASGTTTFGLFAVTDIAKYAPYGHGSCAIATHRQSPEQVAAQLTAALRALPADARAAPASPNSGASIANADGGG